MPDYDKLYKDVEDVSDENIDVYVKLDTKKIKPILNIVIFVTILIILLTSLLTTNSENDKTSLEYYNVLCFIIIIAVILNRLISFILHYYAYRTVKSARVSEGNIGYLYKKIKQIKKMDVIKKNILIYMSPDYHYALFYKDRLKSEIKANEKENIFRDEEGYGAIEWDRIKIERKFFVKYSNWLNVYFIIFVSFIVLILDRLNFHGIFFDVIFYFLLVRLLSRGIEIIIAYYNDVVNINFKIFKKDKKEGIYINNKKEKIYIKNWKSSAIGKSSRISLAIYTLFEMIVTFSLLYYFIISGNLIITPNDIPISYHSSYFDVVLYSLSVNLFNFSYMSNTLLIWRILHVAQVFIGFVLIVLSLAGYLGLDERIIEREKRFYKTVEERKKLK